MKSLKEKDLKYRLRDFEFDTAPNKYLLENENFFSEHGNTELI